MVSLTCLQCACTHAQLWSQSAIRPGGVPRGSWTGKRRGIRLSPLQQQKQGPPPPSRKAARATSCPRLAPHHVLMAPCASPGGMRCPCPPRARAGDGKLPARCAPGGPRCAEPARPCGPWPWGCAGANMWRKKERMVKSSAAVGVGGGQGQQERGCVGWVGGYVCGVGEGGTQHRGRGSSIHPWWGGAELRRPGQRWVAKWKCPPPLQRATCSTQHLLQPSANSSMHACMQVAKPCRAGACSRFHTTR